VEYSYWYGKVCERNIKIGLVTVSSCVSRGKRYGRTVAESQYWTSGTRQSCRDNWITSAAEVTPGENSDMYNLTFRVRMFPSEFCVSLEATWKAARELEHLTLLFRIREVPGWHISWGISSVLSENTCTKPRTGAFLNYCHKMPKPYLKLGPFPVTVRKCRNNI
jgi:hypothetical protein